MIKKNYDKQDILVSGKQMVIKQQAFQYPLDSSFLFNMFELQPGNGPFTMCAFTLNDILCKMMIIKVYELENEPQEWYAVPLLHCETQNVPESELE